MKKVFFLLTALLTLSSFGQTYYPFPTDSATWSVEEYYWGWFPDPDGCIAKHYGLVGDTIIDGKTYSKLFGNNLSGDYPYSDTTFNIATANYVAAVREDSTKKIWIREPNDTIDVLYYDFALDTGDTFCFNYFGMGCFPVSYIDSILINGNYRRQIYFQTWNLETWIEGIGSTTGWFQWQYGGTDSWQLLCYKENQNLLYGGSYCHCDSYTGINDLNTENIEAKVYPNPTTGKLTIELKDKTITSFSISNLLGEVMMERKLSQQETKVELNLKNFAEGVYYIQLNAHDKKYLQKLIVLH